MKGLLSTISRVFTTFFTLTSILVLTAPIGAAASTSNSWTSAGNGNWQDNTWSLKAPPGPGQYVYVTNSGSKEVIISTNTTKSYPDTMQVQAVELCSQPGGTNRLWLDTIGLKNPLRVGPADPTVNAFSISGAFGAFIVNASALMVDGDISLTGNGRVKENAGSQVTASNLYLQANSLYTITNCALYAGNEYVGYYNSGAQMMQQGGTNQIVSNLDVIAGSEYDLYDGLLSGSSFTLKGNFYQWGGSLQMQTMGVTGTTFEHLGGDCNVSQMLSLTNATWNEGANGGQFGQLQLQATNWLAMPPTNACVMTFLNSSSLSWPAQTMFYIQGWNGSQSGGGQHQIFFGTDATGLSAQQLAHIAFANPAGLPAGYYAPSLLPTGELVPSTNRVPPPLNLIDVNFGHDYYTAAEVGFAATGITANDFWNYYNLPDSLPTFGSLSPLLYVDSTVSGAGLTISNANGSWYNNAADPMYNNYLYPGSGGNIVVTVTNLTPGQYAFYLYGHGNANYQNSTFHLVDQTAGSGSVDYGSLATADSPNYDSPTWQNGLQYVLFPNMTVTSTGDVITVTVSPSDSQYAVISGMQIMQLTSTLLPPPPKSTNIWLSATSGFWEDANWSLGVLPGTNQLVYFTNYGWKAVEIGSSTVQNHPETLNIQTLTISGPTNSMNTLLMNYAGPNTPLVIGNSNGVGSLLVESNGVFDMLSSSLVVYDDTNVPSNPGLFSIRGTFNESDGSHVCAGFMTLADGAPGVFNLTNSLLSVNQYELLSPYGYPSEFNQYGGTNATASLTVSSSGFYNLYAGRLSVTNLENIGSVYSTYCVLAQFGGTNSADSISVSDEGEYDFYGGFIQAPILLNGGTFNQWSGTISSANFPITFGDFCNYHLASGIFDANGTLSLNGGSMLQTGGTNYAGDVTVQSNVYNPAFSNHPAPGYVLSNGVLQATSLTVQSFSDPNGARLNRGGGFVQYGGFHTNGLISLTGQIYWPFNWEEITLISTYTMAGGILQAPNMNLYIGNLTQNGGTNLITGTLTVGQYSSANLNGGLLLAQNLIITNGATVTHAGGICHIPELLTLANATWNEGTTNQQFGQLQMPGSSWSFFYLPGTICVTRFADSSSVPWGTNCTLTFMNWNGSLTGGGFSQIYFSTNASGLTSQQLSRVHINDMQGRSWSARILPTGEIVPDTGATLLKSSFISNGNLQLLVVGEAQHTYQVQVSTNLVDWTPWIDVPTSSGSFQITDTSATNYPCRFFRTIMTQ